MRNNLKLQIKPIYIIILFALLLRLALAFGFEATGDTGGWILGGRTGLEKTQLGLGNGTVYDGACTAQCVNWPPLTYHYMIAMRWSYLHLNPFQLPEFGFYKLVSVFADVGIVILLFLISKRFHQPNPLAFAAIYAFHPIALYVSGFHGQRDSVWLFGLLLSTLLLENKKILLSALILGIACATKIPVILYLPYVVLSIKGFQKKIQYILVFMITFVLLSLPEIITYPNYILEKVVGYKGLYGFWGLSGIIAKIGRAIGIANAADIAYVYQKYCMLASVAIISLILIYKKCDRFISLFIINLAIMAISPSYAIQYFIWLLPFIVLYSYTYTKFLFLYTAFCIFLFINTYTIPGFPVGATRISNILSILQNQLFYKIPGFIYPLDLSWPIWLLILYYLWKITVDNIFPISPRLPIHGKSNQ